MMMNLFLIFTVRDGNENEINITKSKFGDAKVMTKTKRELDIIARQQLCLLFESLTSRNATKERIK